MYMYICVYMYTCICVYVCVYICVSNLDIKCLVTSSIYVPNSNPVYDWTLNFQLMSYFLTSSTVSLSKFGCCISLFIEQTYTKHTQ